MKPLDHTRARQWVQDAADGRLGPSEQETLQAHLLGCAECQAYAGELQVLEADIKRVMRLRWDGNGLPPHSIDRIMRGTQDGLNGNGGNSMTGTGRLLLLVLCLGIAAAGVFLGVRGLQNYAGAPGSPNGNSGPTAEAPIRVLGVTATQTAAADTATATPEPPCIWTADLNVFVRRGPGSSNYDEVDEMVKGDSAPVIGESEDGQFWAVESSPGVVGYVPKAERFGHADGDCAKPKFTPPPTRVPSKIPGHRPQCSDGIDNDGDGRIDFAGGGGGDLQCRNAADNDESTP